MPKNNEEEKLNLEQLAQAKEIVRKIQTFKQMEAGADRDKLYIQIAQETTFMISPIRGLSYAMAPTHVKAERDGDVLNDMKSLSAAELNTAIDEVLQITEMLIKRSLPN